MVTCCHGELRRFAPQNDGASCYASSVNEPKKSPLQPAVGRRQPKTNAWWYKLTAVSFTLKVALVIALVLTVKYAADAAQAEHDDSARDSETTAPEKAATTPTAK